MYSRELSVLSTSRIALCSTSHSLQQRAAVDHRSLGAESRSIFQHLHPLRRLLDSFTRFPGLLVLSSRHPQNRTCAEGAPLELRERRATSGLGITAKLKDGGERSKGGSY